MSTRLEKNERTTRSVVDQMGGPLGLTYSVVPVIVFVLANTFMSLTPTIALSITAGVGLFVVRLVRGERIASAVGSLVSVAVAIGIVMWTGSARDFFVVGIWASLAGFVLTAGSLLARRPVSGVIWNAVHGGRNNWRAHPGDLRAHDIATAFAALVFGARFVIQQWLYVQSNTGGLGIARLAMGTPLTILAALLVVWAFRRSTTSMRATTSPASDDRHPERTLP